MNTTPRFRVSRLRPLATGSFVPCCCGCGVCLLVLVVACSRPQADPQAPTSAGGTRAEQPAGKGHGESNKRPLTIATFPPDGGIMHGLGSAIEVRFSKPVDPQGFSFQVTPDPGGWEAQWGPAKRSVRLGHANPFVDGSEYKLQLRIKAPELKHEIRFVAYGPSSLQLIAKAEAEKRIDLDTAWTYRLQAVFEPGRLPPDYRGAAPIRCGTTVLGGFRKIQGKLRPATLQELKPYLVRPTHPASIFNRRLAKKASAAPQDRETFFRTAFQQEKRPPRYLNGYLGEDSNSCPVTVWSPEGPARVEEVLGILEQTGMYSKFKDLMGKEPLSDAGALGPDGQVDDGGDGRLDIYLVPSFLMTVYKVKDAGGVCVPTGGAAQSPAWIAVDQSLRGTELGATLAHEIFHAFQKAFYQDAAPWWVEGTAVWAEDFVAPEWNSEQDYLPDAFAARAHRFESLTLDNGDHEYGAYLFPYYLSKKKQYGPKVIAAAWRNHHSTDNTAESSLYRQHLGGCE